jgi:hypothetical protein
MFLGADLPINRPSTGAARSARPAVAHRLAEIVDPLDHARRPAGPAPALCLAIGGRLDLHPNVST